MSIIKNGLSADPGIGRIEYTPQGNAYMTITSGLVACKGGDIFQVRVRQTSGGALSVISGLAVSVQIEVVE
ncbi:hypothetical protein D3C76_1605000 [compost metagenome]